MYVIAAMKDVHQLEAFPVLQPHTTQPNTSIQIYWNNEINAGDLIKHNFDYSNVVNSKGDWYLVDLADCLKAYFIIFIQNEVVAK